jgi:hypothetical protein
MKLDTPIKTHHKDLTIICIRSNGYGTVEKAFSSSEYNENSSQQRNTKAEELDRGLEVIIRRCLDLVSLSHCVAFCKSGF